MEYKDTNAGYGYVIRLAKGERVMEQLTLLAEKENITGGFFYGIGAVKNTTLGRFDVSKKEYAFNEFPEVHELASIQGDVSLVGGPNPDGSGRSSKPFVHAHAVLAREDLSAIAGHVKEMEVAVTCELFMHLQHGATMLRKPDDDIGINLLHFE